MGRGKGEDKRVKREGETEKREERKKEKGKRGRKIERNRNGLKQIKSFRDVLERFRIWNWLVQASKP